jgi:hypothetical protein
VIGTRDEHGIVALPRRPTADYACSTGWLRLQISRTSAERAQALRGLAAYVTSDTDE